MFDAGTSGWRGLCPRPFFWLCAAIGVVLASEAAAASPVTVRQPQGGGVYDVVTVELDGPVLDAGSGPNPFADYRLDVTFGNGGATWRVPGYFAGCRDAADRDCARGGLWKAHFVPSRAGEWTYRLRFRTARDIVATDAPGAAVPDLDGLTGRLRVGMAPRNAVRARGLLRYTGESLYRWSGDGRVAFKIGPDSPENMLAFAGFARTPDSPPPKNLVGVGLGITAQGLRKSWSPHLGDFERKSAGAYLWNGGRDGRALLGMFRYLSGAGVNSVSMLLFNVGGDDRNVVPQLLKVPPNDFAALAPEDQWGRGVHKDRYDVSKLAQWARALAYADELGLRLHFKLMEQENNGFMDGGGLGRERRIYLREMVARFGAALGATWNLGEENDQASVDQAAAAAYLAALDPYRHPIVLHTMPHEKERYRPLLGDRSALTGLSLQGLSGLLDDVRPDIVKWSGAARDAGRPLVIGYDELGGPFHGAPVDPSYAAGRPPGVVPANWPAALRARADRAAYRRGAIWNALTAGAEGIEVYYGFFGGCGDLDCQDHRSRGEVFADGARAVRFFEEHIGEAALRMRPIDDLTPDGGDYVFAEPGQTYLIFTTLAKPARLSLLSQTGRFRVSWFDPVAGGPMRQGSAPTIVAGGPAAIPIGDPPSGGSGEWAVLVRREE